MRSVDFAILIITFNRPALVAHTLESLRRQTCQSFQVRLIDNGSNPPLNPSTLPQLPNLEFRRLDKNQHPSDVAEQNWEDIPGDYFTWLHDDDAFTPHTLETVKAVTEAKPNAEYVYGNCEHFDHQLRHSIPVEKPFSGRLLELDGQAVARGHCGIWGLDIEGANPPYTHNSATFVSRNLLARTRERQGRIFIKPFGDVGLFGAVGLARKAHYLDVPLAVIGHTAVRELRGSARNGRRHFLPEVAHLTCSPLRGATFTNLVAESHLKVAEALGFFERGKPRFKTDFFFSHLAHILTDDPFDGLTLRDAVETVAVARKTLGPVQPRTLKAFRRRLKVRSAFFFIRLAALQKRAQPTLGAWQKVMLKIAGRFVAAQRVRGFARKADDADAAEFENIVEYGASLPRPELAGAPVEVEHSPAPAVNA